jgi:hypothetical protein
MSFYDFIPPTLAPRETIASQVAEYDAGIAAIRELHECAERCCRTVKIRKKHERYASDLTFDLEHALQEHLKDHWRRVIAKMQVQEACSATRWKEIEEQIERADVPEFTAENVEALCRSFMQELPQMFKEACAEVLEWLRPGNWDHYKTNEKNARFEIGRKVIKTWMVNSWARGEAPHLNYDREKILRSLHTVFKMLDGKGVARYPEDLPTQIKQAMKDRACREYANEYVRCRWFVNGNMHFEFLREDLLAEFNAVVHGKTLRQSAEVGTAKAG